MEGTVKFFNRKKGFGFVHGDDGNDYFVHFTALPRGLFLRDNDKVSFDTEESDRGLKATNVNILEKGSERTDLPEEGEEAPAEEEQPEEESQEEAPAEEEAPVEEPEQEETPAEEEAPAEEPKEEEAPAEEEKKEE